MARRKRGAEPGQLPALLGLLLSLVAQALAFASLFLLAGNLGVLWLPGLLPQASILAFGCALVGCAIAWWFFRVLSGAAARGAIAALAWLLYLLMVAFELKLTAAGWLLGA